MDDHSILFVFGPARGGTTYLSSIMDEWFDVGMGPEGTFIPAACRMAQRLGDIENSFNRKKYIEFLSRVEMLEIIRKRYPDDKSFDVSPGDISQRMPGHSVADGIFAVFKSVADYRKKSRVGNKNPAYWKYLNLLLELFPENSYFIFIVRDGRDVALSLKEVPWGGHSSYEAAFEWRNMIWAVDSFHHKISEKRFLTVHYEKLLSEPEEQMVKIGEFLGDENSKNISKDFLKSSLGNEKNSNYDKWKDQMSTDDIRVFESIAGNELKIYGYERQFVTPKISFYQTIKFETQRFIRLARLNLYQFGRKLPQDAKKWKASTFKSFFRPGGEEK